MKIYDSAGQPYHADLVEGEKYRELERENARLNERLNWWIENAEGLAQERAALRDTLRELNHRVHSGYDFNADPDGMTLRVGAALTR